MLNSAVLHLASLAETGTTVSVVSSLPKQEVSQTPEASPPTQAQPRAESAEPPALTVNNAGNRPNPDRVPDYRALRDFTPRFASLLTAAFINQLLQGTSGSTSVPRFPRTM
jgi:hypothetical protein